MNKDDVLKNCLHKIEYKDGEKYLVSELKYSVFSEIPSHKINNQPFEKFLRERHEKRIRIAILKAAETLRKDCNHQFELIGVIFPKGDNLQWCKSCGVYRKPGGTYLFDGKYDYFTPKYKDIK